MNLNYRLLIINITLVALSFFVLIGIVSVNNSLSHKRELTSEVNGIQSAIVLATDIATAAFKYDQASSDVFLKPINKALKRIDSLMEDEKLYNYSTAWISTVTLSKALKNSQQLYLTIDNVHVEHNEDHDRFHAVSHLQDKLLDQLHQELKLTILIQEQINTESTRLTNRTHIVIIAVVVVVTGFIFTLIWLVISSIRTGLDKLRMVMDNSLKGNFDRKPLVASTNELGVFARELHSMIESLQKLTIRKSEIEDIVTKRTEELEVLSNTDSLTGIRNRRQLESIALAEISRAERFNQSISIALIDVDLFKDVNDRFGHHCGDKALVELCGLVSSQLREHDYFFRYGGEEFLILLPESNLTEATALIERLRISIEKKDIQCNDNVFSITISAGISSYNSSHSGFSELLQETDKLLYRAKSTGRNMVVSADQ